MAYKLIVYFGDYQKLKVFDGDDSGWGNISPIIPSKSLKIV